MFSVTQNQSIKKNAEWKLYNNTMKVLEKNDKAVMEAYGFKTKMTESECVGKLFGLYEGLTEKKK